MSGVVQIMKVDNSPQQRFFLSVGLELSGFTIVASKGIARGITVRSATLCSTICALLCSFGGGRNGIFTHLCELARDEAMQLMIQQAIVLGGNAIIGFRYESHDIADGITEVLAYGTAVLVEDRDGTYKDVNMEIETSPLLTGLDPKGLHR